MEVPCHARDGQVFGYVAGGRLAAHGVEDLARPGKVKEQVADEDCRRKFRPFTVAVFTGMVEVEKVFKCMAGGYGGTRELT